MARTIIIDIVDRPRPKLKTPAKGSDGDLTNESQSPYTDINFILKRYAGNLAEMQAWRGKLEYGDQSSLPDDLVDAFNIMKDAHDAFETLEDNPFKSFDDAMAAIADGSFLEKIAKKEPNVHTPVATDDPPVTDSTLEPPPAPENKE